MDDGHLGYEYVPSGGYCDPDVFMGAIWYQRIKQFLLNNGTPNPVRDPMHSRHECMHMYVGARLHCLDPSFQ